MTNTLKDFIEKYTEMAQVHNRIPIESYLKYNVKRGLRNADGTGVLVGLTEIGDVHGYIIDENEKIPAEGRLRYRGININDLVAGFQGDNRFGYEEAVYLLLFGILPPKEELDKFSEIMGQERQLPENFIEDIILQTPSRDIMNNLMRNITALYAYDEYGDNLSVTSILRQCIQMISIIPILAAYSYHAVRYKYYDDGLHLNPIKPELSMAEHFLHLLRPDGKYTKLEAELLDLCLVLHMEHGGGNNSTFTTHVVSSAGTDSYSAMLAAMASLKGAKHGGANIKVWKMMQDIKEHVKNWQDEKEVGAYLLKILEKKAYDKQGLVYGMGHAVYTLSDPRAVLLKKKARELAKVKKREEEFELFNLIESIFPEIFYEKRQDRSKPISANVDYYSGFVYSMLGIPEELFTPLFAIARMSGWAAHRVEEVVSGGKIMRPAYKNISQSADYIPLEKRNP